MNNDISRVVIGFKFDFDMRRISVMLHFQNDEIGKELKEIENRKDLSCLALFILTHGGQDGTLYTYNSELNLNKDIIDKLLPTNCKQLAGKPKLVFVQACQGDETDSGTQLYGCAPETLERYLVFLTTLFFKGGL